MMATSVGELTPEGVRRELSSWPWGACAGDPLRAGAPIVLELARTAEWDAAWEHLHALAREHPRAAEADTAYTAALGWMSQRFGIVVGCLATGEDTAAEIVAGAFRECALEVEAGPFSRWATPIREGHTRLIWRGERLHCEACDDVG